jgi:hypothetical protein
MNHNNSIPIRHEGNMKAGWDDSQALWATRQVMIGVK